MRNWLRWLFFSRCMVCHARTLPVRWLWRWHGDLNDEYALVIPFCRAWPQRWCERCGRFTTDAGTAPFGIGELLARGLQPEVQRRKRKQTIPGGWTPIEIGVAEASCGLEGPKR